MFSSTIASLLPFLVVASTENAHPNPSNRRDLSSVGCQNCCINHDCSLGFSNTSPGVCCGTHPRSLDAQCCPLGASCVRCGTRFKCTYTRGVTLQGLCTICSDDKPPECYRSYETSSNMMAFLLPMLLMLCCIIGLCMYQRRSFGGDDDVVMVQGTPAGFTPTGQPVYAQPVYGQQAVYAQPVVVQQGYGGGAGLATGMAAGLVGGMVLDEALRGPGYGYGGGAPMGYGGYPDESRNLGGDAGFEAD